MRHSVVRIDLLILQDLLMTERKQVAMESGIECPTAYISCLKKRRQAKYAPIPKGGDIQLEKI